MSGENEAATDAAAGAIAARAMDGPGALHGGHEAPCLNCGTALVGPHCHRCGQSAHVHRTAGALLHDIAHGVFHFEGRTWRTIPLLFARPGELTRRYIDGERVNFVSPMALFLFSVFLMVAVFGLVGGPLGRVTGPDAAQLATARTEAARELRETQEQIADLAARRQAIEARPATDAARERIATLEAEVSRLRSRERMLRLVASGQAQPPAPRDGVRINQLELETGIARIDDAVRHMAENPALAVYKLQASAYKFSWALIPISLPFIWLMFAFRRDVGLYDHAIFATYSLSAMTLLVVGLSLASAIGLGATPILLALLLFPPWHMYRQLRGTYRLGRAAALIRTIILIIVAYTAALIFFVLLVAMGF